MSGIDIPAVEAPPGVRVDGEKTPAIVAALINGLYLAATPTYKWWNWHDNYDAEAEPDRKWVEVSDAGEAAFRKHDDA